MKPNWLPAAFQGGNVLEDDEVLLGWTVCWCSGCAAWTETQPCRSQACGSSSGHPCTSPTPDTGLQNEHLSQRVIFVTDQWSFPHIINKIL